MITFVKIPTTLKIHNDKRPNIFKIYLKEPVEGGLWNGGYI